MYAACRGRAQLDSASTFTYLPKEALRAPLFAQTSEVSLSASWQAETQLRSALADRDQAVDAVLPVRDDWMLPLEDFCKGQQCVPADPPAATGDEVRQGLSCTAKKI